MERGDDVCPDQALAFGGSCGPEQWFSEGFCRFPRAFADVCGGGLVRPAGFVLTASIPDVTLDVASCGRERR